MKSLSRIRHRKGRCYDLTMRAVLNEPRSARFRLVHGWYTPQIEQRDRPPNIFMGHAWLLLPGGKIYDVVADEYFSRFEYAVRCWPIIGRIYTRRQAARLFLWYDHDCGPWWSKEEMLLLVAQGLSPDCIAHECREEALAGANANARALVA